MEDKMIKIRHELRENQQDLEAFLHDMNSWEEDIKIKESQISKGKTAEEKLPPVRNSLQKKKKKKIKKKESDEKIKPKKISGYDFRAWDKLDVDKLCDEIDQDEKRSSSEYETDEEWELERRKQQAMVEKDMGNDYFKRGEYENAVESYTRGLTQDPSNPILPANRAMALLKLDRYAAAEIDCITALTLDPLYVKAYLRLGSARFGLKKYKEAKEAYEKVLQLEPQNKTAQSEIDKIEKALSKEKMVTHSADGVGLVKAVSKPGHLRSKKPLRRIDIEEIGIEDGAERKAAIARVQEGQSQMKKNLEAQGGELFQKFTSEKSGETNNMNKATDVVKSKQSSVKNKNSVESDSVKLNLTNGVKEVTKQSQTSTSPRQSAGSSSPRSLNVSPRSLDVPTTSYQFQADYKVLKKDRKAFYEYIKKINPEHYPKLFGQSLDADVLLQFLTVFQEYYIPAKEDYYPHMLHLTHVSRFSMAVMFFSRKEKKILETLIDFLRQNSSASSTDIDTLAFKYELR